MKVKGRRRTYYLFAFLFTKSGDAEGLWLENTVRWDWFLRRWGSEFLKRYLKDVNIFRAQF